MSRRSLTLDDSLQDYVAAHSVREDACQVALREATRTHRHGGMQIAPEQGQLMSLLVRLVNAKRAIEVGVFTGYSALTVALALPEDGYLLACDVSEEYTRIGRPFWNRAGVANKIDRHIGPAVQTLDEQIANGQAGTYDFAFIDADKVSYDAYYERCMTLVRSGGMLVLDNTLWGGEVARASTAPDTIALQALNAKLHRDDRIDLSLLPIEDGVTLVRKR